MEAKEDIDIKTSADDLLPLFERETSVQPDQKKEPESDNIKITGLSEIAGNGPSVCNDKKSEIKNLSELKKLPRRPESIKLSSLNDDFPEVSLKRKTFADDLSQKKNINISFGKSLMEMRVQRKISIDEVASQTKIRKDYIDALENEDFSRLPPAVFVCGYVRKICDLYEISEEMTDSIVKLLKENSEYRLSQECLDNIIEPDEDINPDAGPRIRNILLIAGAMILFLILVVVAVIMLSFSGSDKVEKNDRANGIAASPVQFKPEMLDALSPKKLPDGAELSVPR
ncbi:MAG: helix-turn-helix domain-containing protein [Lentisphaerae bacterium]|nr:helix-turn-helix domain-containing protein [Lentisphaerota bacterium]